MDKLVLNVADVSDKEAFLTELQEWLVQRKATANGIFRRDVDPESDQDKGTVQIINNSPALAGRGVKHGSDDLEYQ